MGERYISSEEYETLFITLKREETAKKIKPQGKVLDIASGSAYFSIKVAQEHPNVKIVGVDIFEGSVKTARENICKQKLEDQIKIIQMDASNMKFPDGFFNTVINYLGFEDIHMTRGKTGVEQVFNEVFRVLKSGGYFYFVVIPVGFLDTPAQKIEAEVFSYICGATWLPFVDYLEMLKASGFMYHGYHDFYTGLKLDLEQAREEIEYACKNVPLNYGVQTPSFKEVWNKYKDQIERNGMGHYSKTRLVVAQKI
jgi:ubiquinone/menaquinone biosynthesis C-methylase UbiE